jgi:hypothetical protein
MSVRRATFDRGADGTRLHLTAVLGYRLPKTGTPQELFFQVTGADGGLCGRLPSSSLRLRRGTLKFRDPQRRIPSANGLSKLTLKVGPGGSTLTLVGNRLAVGDLGAGPIDIALSGAIEDRLCASARVTLKPSRDGGLQYP